MRMAFPKVVSWGLWFVVAATGCGRDRVEIIGSLPSGGGSGPLLDGGGAAACPVTLADRLKISTIEVETDIAWRKYGYDGFPMDERVALAVQPNGQAQIAWIEVNRTKASDGSQQPPRGVHVTPLDSNLARRADDVIMPTGLEVSGLVAHDDGFALLARDQNPGAVIDLGDGATVAFLLRYQNGQEKWKFPLTGSESGDAAETFTVYSPFLDGQLVWNGTNYGAYFVVEGGLGDPQEGFWRDALVFRDVFGKLASIWTVTHGCDNNGGIRLIVDPGKSNLVSSTWSSFPEMTGLCVQQVRPAVRFTALDARRLVSDQEVGVSGYSGARLGSLLKIADGYFVFWLSLGATNDHQGHDIRMARLDTNFNIVSGPTWLARTPGVEEWNLHVVPYGPDHFLMVYGEIAITGSPPSDYAIYLGDFKGTHLSLLDASGAVISDEVVQGAPTTANDEPVVLPGGDIAWAFVNPSPDYTQTIIGPSGPGQTALHIARVRFCQ